MAAMGQNGRDPAARRRLLKLLVLASVPAFAAIFFSAANAQQPTQDSTPVSTAVSSPAEATPVAGSPTVEPTPGPNVTTVVRIEVDPQTKPIPEGTEFEARVMVDNVQHLAGFSFKISYDPNRLQPVKASGASTTPASTPGGSPIGNLNGDPVKQRGMGDILVSSPRGSALVCPNAVVQVNVVVGTCVTITGPLCQGGAVGASGSGLLGAVYFKSKGGGRTTLTLTEGTLALDDLAAPCDSTSPTQLIPARLQNANVDLASSGGGSGLLLGVIIGVVVVVVLAGGAAGYIWYRRRQAVTSA